MEIYNTYPDHEGLQAKLDHSGLHPVAMNSQQQYLSQGQPHPQYQMSGSPRPNSTICGLRRTTFWLVIALIAVLVAGVVAGTVGGVLGSQKASSTGVTTTTVALSSPTPTTSASVSVLQSASNTNTGTTPVLTATHAGTASQPSPSSSVLRGGCPGSNGQQWVSASGYNTFRIYCGTDFPVNDMINGEYVPIDNFDACLEFCATLNDKRNFTLCYGVSFTYHNSPSAGCFLKNPAINVASDQISNILVDSAIFVPQ